MYALTRNFKDRIHGGRALVAGSEYVYSSAFDMGEMWASSDIYPASPLSVAFGDLAVAAGGPAATFLIGIAGSAPNNRQYKTEINTTKVIDTVVNTFEARNNYNLSIPLSVIATSATAVKITNSSTNVNDRIVCNSFTLTYPRRFNFGNESAFAFSLPAAATSRYLQPAV
jgi:hypothetical protein